MAKINAAKIRDKFVDRISALETLHRKLISGLSGHETAETAEAMFLAAATAWEAFLNDLFVAYINHDSSKMNQTLRNAIEGELEGRLKRAFVSYGGLTLPKQIDRKTILQLNSQNKSISFSNFNQIRELARSRLVKSKADLITQIQAPDKARIDAWIKIRNYLAHRSGSSLAELNALLKEERMHHTGMRLRNNSIRSVGSYLQARQTWPLRRAETRLEIAFNGMRVIAGRFCP
tara:strand:+ start:174 stop:872 length:699 start_codon:yes stop_codon:yes gene_type:complete